IIRGSGSIARDLGLSNPEESDLKASLIVRLNRVLSSGGVPLEAAAQMFGIESEVLGSLLEGDYADFTVFELMSYLRTLGQDVEIVVGPSTTGHPHLCVTER